ncbi:MAG: hypothetical protein IJ489_09510 [Clostridia bacterium]|nr:hypothetical protein [Clostridia bacterium]
MSKMLFNTRWALRVIVFAILILLGVWTINEDVGISVAIIFIGSLLLLGYILAFPSNYCIYQEGITIYFAFTFKCSAKWNELHTIEDHYCKAFPGLREYHVGFFKTRFPLWKKICIPKNKKTAALIEKYYKRHIDKFD